MITHYSIIDSLRITNIINIALPVDVFMRIRGISYETGVPRTNIATMVIIFIGSVLK